MVHGCALRPPHLVPSLSSRGHHYHYHLPLPAAKSNVACQDTVCDNLPIPGIHRGFRVGQGQALSLSLFLSPPFAKAASRRTPPLYNMRICGKLFLMLASGVIEYSDTKYVLSCNSKHCG